MAAVQDDGMVTKNCSVGTFYYLVANMARGLRVSRRSLLQRDRR